MRMEVGRDCNVDPRGDDAFTLCSGLAGAARNSRRLARDGKGDGLDEQKNGDTQTLAPERTSEMITFEQVNIAVECLKICRYFPSSDV